MAPIDESRVKITKDFDMQLSQSIEAAARHAGQKDSPVRGEQRRRDLKRVQGIPERFGRGLAKLVWCNSRAATRSKAALRSDASTTGCFPGVLHRTHFCQNVLGRRVP